MTTRTTSTVRPPDSVRRVRLAEAFADILGAVAECEFESARFAARHPFTVATMRNAHDVHKAPRS